LAVDMNDTVVKLIQHDDPNCANYYSNLGAISQNRYKGSTVTRGNYVFVKKGIFFL